MMITIMIHKKCPPGVYVFWYKSSFGANNDGDNDPYDEDNPCGDDPAAVMVIVSTCGAEHQCATITPIA